MTVTPTFNETGLYVEQSHVNPAVWVPVTGTIDGALHAGTLAQAKAYVQTLSAEGTLHWSVDKGGKYTRSWAWTVT